MKYVVSQNLNFAIFLAGLVFFSSPAGAQDAHYWTMQYGPKPSLLGGAVIGSVSDVSATFYNPGALSRAKNLSFAVSMNVFEVKGVLLEDGGGEGVNIGRATSGLRPSMIAGTFSDSLFGGAGVLGYSAMNRVKGTQDLEGLIARSGDGIPDDIDAKHLVGLVRFEGEFADFWGGLTYSHRIGSNFGIGATWYIASRSQRRRRETLGEVINHDVQGAIDLDIAGGSYSTLRTLGKFGLYGQLGDLTGGVTVTTPSAHIKGSGDLGLNFATFTPDSAALAFSIQTDLPAEYKTPLSVGAGVGLPIGPLVMHASVEWYDKIDPYVVIQGETVNALEPADEEIPVDAVQELAEVINWGVAAEFRVSKRFNGYVSYYTDNSALTDEIERASLSVLPFDIQTVTIGTDFGVGPALLTLGVGYGWGSQSAEGLTDVIDPGNDNPDARFVFRNMRALFGFEIGV